jgi:hypothetical protein
MQERNGRNHAASATARSRNDGIAACCSFCNFRRFAVEFDGFRVNGDPLVAARELVAAFGFRSKIEFGAGPSFELPGDPKEIGRPPFFQLEFEFSGTCCNRAGVSPGLRFYEIVPFAHSARPRTASVASPRAGAVSMGATANEKAAGIGALRLAGFEN